jgi:hypothetical protein
VLLLLFKLFPSLKLFTARHQLREFVDMPKLPEELKTLSVCLLDKLGGNIPKKKIYRATCVACKALADGECSDDDELGFSLFD